MNIQRKVLYGAYAAALWTLFMWVVELIIGHPVNVPHAVYGAAQLLLVLVVQWWVKNHPGVLSDDSP